ncbi:4'-phosphopantetheinyl transferase family protein [Streptomyces sp. NPDC059578]|uniref:4'-phosphopantetheinyl transferase family protein n=1 Tax=Streptomyces sp. NPDC059578 TaxID=3346874 RepID=UPI0036B9E732
MDDEGTDEGASATPVRTEVRLLWVPDAAAAALARAHRLLDPHETARADRHQDERARRLYVTAHVGLRLLLAAHTGTPPEDLRFTREPCPGCGGPHGRPTLDGVPGLHFSLSHAEDAVLYALASAPVGVDIESARIAAGGDAVLRRRTSRLHPEEQQALAGLPQSRRSAALLGCWVRKEAYGKGLGTGLAGDTTSHPVGLATVDRHRLVAPPPGWTLVDVPAPADYRAAVAVRTPATTGIRLDLGRLHLGPTGPAVTTDRASPR